jgi:hypothetical protein
MSDVDNDIINSETFGSGDWLTYGNAVCVIDKVYRKDTRKSGFCEFWRLWVESASKVNVVDPEGKPVPDAPQNSPGEFRTISFRLDKKDHPGRRKCKEAYLAVMGEEDRKGDKEFDDKLSKVITRARSEEQLLRGAAFAVSSKMIRTQNKVLMPEFTFMKVKQDKTTTAARRAKLESANLEAEKKAEEQKAATPTPAEGETDLFS